MRPPWWTGSTLETLSGEAAMHLELRTVLVLAISACGGSRPAAIAPLPGTSWVLLDIGETPAIQPGRATLSFDESSRASGDGSCNRFSGPVTITGDSLAFGPLLATKRACIEEPLNSQETRYLAALERARRYEVAGDSLLIQGADGATLRFIRATP
jgi:heat shock protein HslJ